jgi:hypothetical protein
MSLDDDDDDDEKENGDANFSSHYSRIFFIILDIIEYIINVV